MPSGFGRPVAVPLLLVVMGAGVGCVKRCAPGRGEGAGAGAGRTLALKHTRTLSLPEGTHRPELAVSRQGELLAVVVQPRESPGPAGPIKHQLHRFDPRGRALGSPRVITRVDATHGEPADHRVALVNGELVVVYQTLRWKKGHPPEGAGPAEDHALDQSLMLARFDTSGKELWRRAIIHRSADLSTDNFPDHCMLWRGGRLLISTGSKAGVMKIREVDLQARIFSTHLFTTSPAAIPRAIGNSMLARGEGLALFSSAGEAGPGGLALVELDHSYRARQVGSFPHPVRDRRFPTSSLEVGGFTLVTYISLPRGSRPDHRSNHYSPYLLVLDRELKVVSDVRVGTGHGYSHVHPTLVRHGKKLVIAWSRRTGGENDAPQVLLEEYAMDLR